LKEIFNFPNTYTKSFGEIVPKMCFMNCEQLKEINLPETITTIDNLAMFHCKNLTYIELPSKLQKIGKNAFMDCEKLEAIQWREPRTNDSILIDDYAFAGCTSLKDLGELENISKLGKYAFAHTKLTYELRFASVEEIGEGCFLGCTNLEYIPIGRIQSIEAYTFAETALEQVTIPKTCRHIEAYAFKDCKKLKEVVFLGDKDKVRIDKRAFDGCDNLKTKF
jgi:hypothetical protein